jgi:hypothetical protein
MLSRRLRAALMIAAQRTNSSDSRAATTKVGLLF